PARPQRRRRHPHPAARGRTVHHHRLGTPAHARRSLPRHHRPPQRGRHRPPRPPRRRHGQPRRRHVRHEGDPRMTTVTLDIDLQARPGPSETVRQTLSMAWRAVMKMRRNPEQLFDVVFQPLLFTAMFTYIFGGAISGSVANYLPLIIPGILAQTALTASMATGVQLREDMDKGVFDRFKSLPIARIAPLAGPMVADLLRYGIAATLPILTGFLMGYRPDGGLFGVLACWLLTIGAGWSIAWIFCWLGTIARSAQAVQGISMMILFPLTFLSNAFVPAE